MAQPGYRYALELIKNGGAVLNRVPATIDWSSAIECARFAAIRRGKLPPVMTTGNSEVQPLWHTRYQRPYVGSFSLSVFGDDLEPISTEIPTTYLQGLARQAANELVETGALKKGEWFYYRVLAFAGDTEGEAQPVEPAPFSVCEVPEPLPLNPGCQSDLLRQAVVFGSITAGDVPVFMPMSVLLEASSLTRRSGANETGGILIGHLRRAQDSPEIFVEVTAQIPAKHACSGLTSLTFTADTWAAVQAAIRLRGRNEVHLGWWHSHSFMKETCKDCEKRASGTCATTASFMSEEDLALHLTCFPRAFSTALVIGDSPCAGLTWELFGWRQGMVVPRGFHVLGVLGPRAEPVPELCAKGEYGNAARSK